MDKLLLDNGANLKEVSGPLRRSGSSLALSTYVHQFEGAAQRAVSNLAKSLLASQVEGRPLAKREQNRPSRLRLTKDDLEKAQ